MMQCTECLALLRMPLLSVGEAFKSPERVSTCGLYAKLKKRKGTRVVFLNVFIFLREGLRREVMASRSHALIGYGWVPLCGEGELFASGEVLWEDVSEDDKKNPQLFNTKV